MGCFWREGWVFYSRDEAAGSQYNYQYHQETVMNYMFPFYGGLSQLPSHFYPQPYPCVPKQQLQTFILVNNSTTQHSEELPHRTNAPQSKPDKARPSSIESEPSSECPKKAKAPKRRQKSKGRDENFGWRKQNKQRNVLSTILKGYVAQALQAGVVQKLVQSMGGKLPVQNGVSAFSAYLLETFPNRKSYVGVKYMQECLGKEGSDREMALILAVTLRLYLRQVFPMEVAKNGLLRKKQKLGLLKKARGIHKTLFGKE